MKICHQCQRSYSNQFANCPHDGTPLSQTGDWVEGTLIRGKYRILEKIGQGAMGAVYKALHVRFNEFRAIKVMMPELASRQEFVKRFEHEAVFVRKLRHPNAVSVEDIDETDDGQVFIVMEYIKGRGLGNLLKSEGPLTVRRVSSIIGQVASALDAAHRIGIVHRDIKPDNIFIVEAPDREIAKVLDFGIAKIKEGLCGTTGLSLTETGMVIGTPIYMSPEQAKGLSSNQIDGRSDLYSLGVVMYQMLTGELPFKGETPLQILLAHMQVPPVPLSVARPDLHIPVPIAELVRQCLEKDPVQRPQMGQEIVEKLELWESGKNQLDRVSETGSRELAEAVLSTTDLSPAPNPNTANSPDHSPILAPSEAQSSPKQSQPAPSSRTRVTFLRGNWSKVAAIPILILIFSIPVRYSYKLFSSTASRGGASQAPKNTPSSTQSSSEPRLQLQSPGTREDSQAVPEHGDTNDPSTPLQSQTHAMISSSKSSRSARGGGSTDIAALTKTINAALTLGDLFYEKGEYDNAVKEYRQGMKVDPTNIELQNRVKRALRAKAAEQSINP